MDIDKYKQADNLLGHINYNQRRVQRIDDFLGSCDDRISQELRLILGDDYNYSRLDNAVNAEVKAYRDKLETEIEQLKKEFEQL